MDLQEATDRLYGGAPGDFIATRATLAKQARTEGDRGAATAIAALRRPTASAALLNALARTDPDAVPALQAIGDELRDAQRRGDGDGIRALGQKRRQVIAATMARVSQLAGDRGLPLSDTVRTEAEASLAAAIADPASADELAGGCLAGPLQQVGFGEWSPEAAVSSGAHPARPALRAVPDLPEPAAKGPTRAQQRAERASSDQARDARRKAVALERAEAATAALAQAQAESASAQERVAQIQAQIDRLRGELADATTAARRAHEAERRAAREASAVMRRLASTES